MRQEELAACPRVGDNRIVRTGLEVCGEQGGSVMKPSSQRPFNSTFLERTLPLP